MSSRGFLEELQVIGEKLLLKLQRLPKADPVEIVSFCVILLFIATVLVMMVIACSCCCYSCCSCAGRPDHRRRKIHVGPVANP